MSSEREKLCTIRAVEVRYRGANLKVERVVGPAEAAAFGRKVVSDHAREHLVAVYLDGRHHPIAYQIVSVGIADQTLVHAREVLQPAILVGANALVLMHNHPSGDPTPSPEDREVTRRIAEAAKIIGISLLDHIVFTHSGPYTSIAQTLPDLLR